MAKEETKNNVKSNSVDTALQKFTDLLIQRMEALTKDWKKGWTGGGKVFGLPQNLTGRTYEGSNAFLLQLHSAMNNYQAPVYMTFLQAKNEGVRINKDEKAIPVFKWGLSIRDENGKRMSESDYRKLSLDEQSRCSVHPYLKIFSEWNIDQTNLAEVNKEKYDALVAGFQGEKAEEHYTGDMYVNEALDRMMQRQEWVCPIQYDKEVQGACYIPSKDIVVLPLKSQFHIHPDDLEESFKDGQEYYGTALHEMAHSTGHESRLNRLNTTAFGSPEYAKEELVAELTSAMVGNALGFDRRISDNNAAYLKSWIKVLKEEPKFIVSVMADVNKASRVVIDHIDRQRIALGEKPLMQGRLDGVEEKAKNEQKLEEVKSAPRSTAMQDPLNAAQDNLSENTLKTNEEMNKKTTSQQGELNFSDDSHLPPDAKKQTIVGNVTVPEEAFIGESKKDGRRYVAFTTEYLEANLNPDGSVDFFVPCTDEHAETQDRVIKAMEQNGYKPDLTSERGYVMNFDNYEEAIKAANIVKELNAGIQPDGKTIEKNKPENAQGVNTPNPKDLVKAYESGNPERIKAEEDKMHMFLAAYVRQDPGKSYQNYLMYKMKNVGVTGNKQFNKYIADTLKSEMVKAGYPKEMFSMREATRLKLAKGTADPKVLDVMFAENNEKVRNAILGNTHIPISAFEHEVERTDSVYIIDQLAMDERYDLLDKLAESTSNERILQWIPEVSPANIIEKALDNPAMPLNTLHALIRPWNEEREFNDERKQSNEVVAKARHILQERDPSLNLTEQMPETDTESEQIANGTEDIRQEETTKDKEQEKEDKQEQPQTVPSKQAVQASILLAALAKAGEQDGVWMNKACKDNARFLHTKTPVSAYNNLMMNLESDLKGFKTNIYTHYSSAKANDISIKKGQTALPFNWTKWGYQNIFKPQDVINQQEYDRLPDTDKAIYFKRASHVTQSIFNIDQTTYPSKDKKGYSALLKEEGITPSAAQSASETSLFGKFQAIKEKHPDAMLLFRTGDFYETYNEDAKKAGDILGITVTRPKNGEMEHLAGFPYYALDTYLPKLVRAGQRVAICDKPEDNNLARQGISAQSILEKAYATAKEVAKASGMKYESVKVLQPAGYDKGEDKLVVSVLKSGTVGNERHAAAEKANDIYRAVVASLGVETRLDRAGRNNFMPADDAKYEKLVQELAAGVLMARQGLPATLSKDSQTLIPVWTKELQENPRLMNIIQRDVNNAVETIDKLVAGREVNYEAIRGLSQTQAEEKSRHTYSILARFADLPDVQSKEFILVIDQNNKQADLILPQGAALYTHSETDYSMDSIAAALNKEGIEDIGIYNTGGDRGLNQPDAYFRNKEVSLCKMKGDELVVQRLLDVSKEAGRESRVDIVKFQAIKDDNGRYAFYIKPKDEPSFSVYPPKEHLNTFFKVINTPEQKEIHDSLARKWHDIATKRPEIKVDLITPRKVDVDAERIVRPTVTSSVHDHNQKVVMAIIDGKREIAPITRQQWNRMWLADDMAAYKKALAAVVFEPVLKQAEKQEQHRDVETQLAKGQAETPESTSRGIRL